MLHVCGSGMSIAQAMFDDMSNEFIIVGGLPSSFTFEVPALKEDIVGPEAGGGGTEEFDGSREEDATLLLDGFGGDVAGSLCACISESITGSA